MKRIALAILALTLAGCQEARRGDAVAAQGQVAAPSQGVFDNHEQVWRAKEAAPGGVAPPHVVVSIEATPKADWTLWHVRLETAQTLEAVWALHRVVDAGGATTLVPHRALVAAPASPFDEKAWTPLDACALRGTGTDGTLKVGADLAACSAIAPGIGAGAALLPLAIEREGEWLHVRLYADQARGADAREDAREVRWFGGWAAVNGGGASAAASNRDWHMDRAVRLGSEGGRYALKWRDGSASGYSLMLERLTYREGNVPVLKLSIVGDDDGSTLAYAWANPEATRIGINLGWVQVGLDREDTRSK